MSISTLTVLVSTWTYSPTVSLQTSTDTSPTSLGSRGRKMPDAVARLGSRCSRGSTYADTEVARHFRQRATTPTTGSKSGQANPSEPWDPWHSVLQAEPPAAAEPEEATFPRWRGLETLSQYASYVLRPLYSIAPGLCRRPPPACAPFATPIQTNSRHHRKGQISPLTVDVGAPVGVDFHAASTDSIAGPPASVRPRYTHHRPRGWCFVVSSWPPVRCLAARVEDGGRRGSSVREHGLQDHMAMMLQPMSGMMLQSRVV